MNLEILLIIWLAIVVVSAVVVSYLAHRWGHDPFGWVLLAAAMGPLAIVALVGRRQAERGTRPRAAASSGAPVLQDGPVLVACDGSTAVRQLAERAREAAYGREIVLLAVLPHEAREAGTLPAEAEGAARRMTAEGERILRAAGLSVREAVRYGAPGEEIVRHAEDEGASLIIIGRRGSGLTRALLGSVSTHVLQHATRPVLLVG